MKKLFTFLLALAASVGTIFAESGTCGPNLKWDLTEGFLTITGIGAMDDYSFSSYAPWYASRSSIKTVAISDGVTSIGSYAFYECRSLTSVTIPNSVTSIGKSAFAYCSSLTSATIPNSVTSIGDGAFYYCSSLTSIKIPNSVSSIGTLAFAYCNNLTSVVIGNGVIEIRDGAFIACPLKDITIGAGLRKIFLNAFTNVAIDGFDADGVPVPKRDATGNLIYTVEKGMKFIKTLLYSLFKSSISVIIIS